jgi:curved DNA-binding protein CbpA
MSERIQFRADVDYYEVLRVAATASSEEVRRAFKQLVLECHPDKNPGRRQWSERRIRELIQAYEVLGNVEKREAFDRVRRAAKKGRPAEPFFLRKKTPGARALLILHYLLNRRPHAAAELVEEMEETHGEGYLRDYLDSKDYLDCLFLLGEHYTAQRKYLAAVERLRTFYLHERGARFPRHYYGEVIRLLKDLYLRKLPRTVKPAVLLRFLKEATALGLTPQEDLLRLKKLAEAQALTGAFAAARRTLAEIQQRDPHAKGLRKIENLLAKRA